VAHIDVSSPSVHNLKQRVVDAAWEVLAAADALQQQPVQPVLQFVNVAMLGKQTLCKAAYRWLAEASQAEIRRAIIEVRGETAAANLTTRLNDQLARAGKHRPLIGKNGHSAGNGHAAGNGRMAELSA
jgi:hypothetical protein